MKALILGDIFGRTGRRMVRENIDTLRARYAPDIMIANSENMTSGKGPIMQHVREMESLGFDVLTGGNHVFANYKDSPEIFDSPESIQIRPLNYFESAHYRVPGVGYRIVEKGDMKVLVVNLMSSVFMRDNLDNPFLAADRLLTELRSDRFDAVFVDFHRETTAELCNMAYFLDGRVSVVYGTHTHVQTNDEQIFPNGTGMITDVGMTGPLDSSIGQNFESRLPQFLSGTNLFTSRPEQVIGHGVLTGIFVEIQEGKCIHIEKIRIREDRT